MKFIFTFYSQGANSSTANNSGIVSSHSKETGAPKQLSQEKANLKPPVKPLLPQVPDKEEPTKRTHVQADYKEKPATPGER